MANSDFLVSLFENVDDIRNAVDSIDDDNNKHYNRRIIDLIAKYLAKARK